MLFEMNDVACFDHESDKRVAVRVLGIFSDGEDFAAGFRIVGFLESNCHPNLEATPFLNQIHLAVIERATDQGVIFKDAFLH